MPRHGGYERMNGAALDSMQGMYDEDYEMNGGSMGSGIGSESYDKHEGPSPESLGNDMNLGMPGQDSPSDGAGMSGMYNGGEGYPPRRDPYGR